MCKCDYIFDPSYTRLDFGQVNIRNMVKMILKLKEEFETEYFVTVNQKGQERYVKGLLMNVLKYPTKEIDIDFSDNRMDMGKMMSFIASLSKLGLENISIIN
jgi:hypothetical protein